MNDEHRHNHNGGFEHEDLPAKPVFGFLIGLAAFGVLVYFGLTGMYRALDHYFETHQAAQSPLKPVSETGTRDTDTAKVRQDIEKTFPEPRLESDERTEINSFRMHEEEHLGSYGWIDRKAGTAYIPIERAMQLVAQRGLPVASGGSAATPGSKGKAMAENSKP